MRSLLICIACLLIGSIGYSQNIKFTQLPPPLPNPQIIANINGIAEGAQEFVDIDNDNDLDIFLIGINNPSSAPLLEIYLNDGQGNYTKKTTSSSFVAVYSGDIAFADIDNDADLDVFISGRLPNFQATPVSRLYLNDGSGNFSYSSNHLFTQLSESSAAFIDVDGDNDLDLFSCGKNASGKAKSELYINDGLGGFTLDSLSNFKGVRKSTIDFGDIDLDNDNDLIISGLDSTFKPIAALYTNDGSGLFTLQTDTSFSGVEEGALSFADADGDLDLDLFMCGKDSSGSGSAQLYLNDGMGNFTKVNTVPFIAVEKSALELGDVDNDHDLDLVITGTNNASQRIAQYFKNDGNGNFTSVANHGLHAVNYGKLNFADIDGDLDKDLLLTGHNPNTQGRLAELFINDSTGQLTKVEGSPFTTMLMEAAAFGDLDGDGDEDLLLTTNGPTEQAGKVYYNDGTGSFTGHTDIAFSGYEECNLKLADVDNDGDLDAIITSKNAYPRFAKLLLNDGTGKFNLVANSPFSDIGNATISIADVDNDNDIDVLISGTSFQQNSPTELYINDGFGGFSSTPIPFTKMIEASTAFADIDSDGDQDVILAGSWFGQGDSIAIYLNNGNGNFSIDLSNQLPSLLWPDCLFTDQDNDGDQDLILAGFEKISLNTLANKPRIYFNDGTGKFSTSALTPLANRTYHNIISADIDKDGYNDLFTYSGSAAFPYKTELYLNNRQGNYFKYTALDINNNTGIIALGDIDADQDLDLVSGGLRSPTKKAMLYRNETCAQYYIDSIKACERYQWADGKFYYDNDSTARHTITTSNGCDSVLLLKLELRKGFSTLITVNGKTIEAIQNSAFYQWLDCDNDNLPIAGAVYKSYTPTKSGRYAVAIGDSFCYGISACKLITGIGLEESFYNDQITLYPNPSSGTIYISLGEETNQVEISIKSISGQLLRKIHYTKSSGMSIELNQASGIYIVEVSTEKRGRKSFRVIKE